MMCHPHACNACDYRSREPLPSAPLLPANGKGVHGDKQLLIGPNPGHVTTEEDFLSLLFFPSFYSTRVSRERSVSLEPALQS